MGVRVQSILDEIDKEYLQRAQHQYKHVNYSCDECLTYFSFELLGPFVDKGKGSYTEESKEEHDADYCFKVPHKQLANNKQKVQEYASQRKGDS